MPAPFVSAQPKRRGLTTETFSFGGGLGQFDHSPGLYAIMTNGDDRFGKLIPGPREVADMTGIASGFRVVDQVKHNDVNMIATTNGTDSKIYREESSAWAEKETATNSVATCIVSFNDGTDSIVAVGYGSAVAFRFSTNDGSSWTASTLSGNAKYITRAFVDQNGATARVAYVVDPDEVYFADSLDNSATVTTAENVGSGNATDDYFTAVLADDQGALLICKRHLVYRRLVLGDLSVVYEIVSPHYDDNQGDAGGQSDRLNFDHPVQIQGRTFFPANGYVLAMWYQGHWSSGLEPREAHPYGSPRIPRLDWPINAMTKAGDWLILALGSKNSATLKSVTNAPGGSNLLQNSFATTSELYFGHIISTDKGDAIRWHGSLLTCTDPLRFMWFDEDDSYLYLASGDSESANAQQNRALVYTAAPDLATSGGNVILNNGTVTVEFGRYTAGSTKRKLLRRASLRATGLSANVTAAVRYRNEPGRNTSGAYKTLVTYTNVEHGVRGTAFPTSRTFEEVWMGIVLTGNSNSYAIVESLELLSELL